MLLGAANRKGRVVTVPAPVVGEVWRDGARQARLATVLAACRIESTTDDQGADHRRLKATIDFRI